VAAAIGLGVREVKSTGFDGALQRIRWEARGIVAVRGSMGLGRTRFTIAHEIGHYVFHHGAMTTVCHSTDIEAGTINSSNDEEVAANRFASELLLPVDHIGRIIREQCISLNTIKSIARQFKTSLTAAVIQGMAVTAEPCAAVVTVDGVVRFYKPSNSWKYFIPVGSRLDGRSMAARLDLREGEATGKVPSRLGSATNT